MQCPDSHDAKGERPPRVAAIRTLHLANCPFTPTPHLLKRGEGGQIALSNPTAVPVGPLALFRRPWVCYKPPAPLAGGVLTHVKESWRHGLDDRRRGILVGHSGLGGG